VLCAFTPFHASFFHETLPFSHSTLFFRLDVCRVIVLLLTTQPLPPVSPGSPWHIPPFNLLFACSRGAPKTASSLLEVTDFSRGFFLGRTLLFFWARHFPIGQRSSSPILRDSLERIFLGFFSFGLGLSCRFVGDVFLWHWPTRSVFLPGFMLMKRTWTPICT